MYVVLSSHLIQWLEMVQLAKSLAVRLKIKPENIYFTGLDGNRGAVMVVDVPNPSHIAVIVEPWYLNFEAVCEFSITMTPEDIEIEPL